MKIAVVTPLYAIAGVPLAQIRLARCLSAQGHDVDIIFGRVVEQYTLPDLIGLNVINLKCRNVRGMFFPLLRYLKSAKFDVIFSAEDHLNTIILLTAIAVQSNALISCSSRVTPLDTYSNKPFSKRWFLKILMRSVMWRANVLTCVSIDMVAQYRHIFKNSKHTCVYNIVADGNFHARATEPVEHPWLQNTAFPVLIAAGRLAPWKGFADLISAVALVKKERNIRLLILGDGPLRSELQAQIDKSALSDSIQLIGYVDNPLKYFTRADIFVLSSHVEGLPNVLVEAMMCGCTPVATDCPTGPKEVLDGGRFGYLVTPRDPRALADGILKAIQTPISSELLHEALRPFQEDTVISRHFELLGLSEHTKAIDL
jgi:glycosyltransferase involved in cell wall biosynthesis